MHSALGLSEIPAKLEGKYCQQKLKFYKKRFLYLSAVKSATKTTVMKKFKKILKWTGIVLLSLIVIFAALVFILQNKTFSAPYPNIHASTDSAIIARGQYLAFGPAHCSGCHSPKENQERIDK